MSLPGKEIFHTHDDYGPLIVTDDGERRFMAFSENDEQSCLLKKNPALLQHDYCRAMLLVLLFKQPKTLLMFGLGGGSLATALHHHVPGLKNAYCRAARGTPLPRTPRMGAGRGLVKPRHHHSGKNTPAGGIRPSRSTGASA